MSGFVESAIRKTITPGEWLKTPDTYKGAPFQVANIDSDGIILLFGKKRTPTRITWKCLEGIPAFLRGKGWVVIGTIFYTWSNPATLDGYLKEWINRGTAGWVAAVLEKAGVVEIDRNRPMRVRLKQ